MEMALTSNTISIHWFTASWSEEEFLIAKEYDDFFIVKLGNILENSAYIFVTIFIGFLETKNLKN